jgi:isopentenyldiphosphate isomerase
LKGPAIQTYFDVQSTWGAAKFVSKIDVITHILISLTLINNIFGPGPFSHRKVDCVAVIQHCKESGSVMDSITTEVMGNPQPPTSLSAEELVEIVDENNIPQEPRLRKDMRAKRLIHRATYAFVRTSNNYFYVQKRSAIKDYCPGYFDPTPGGVVAAGETYEETNKREIDEEMGINGVPAEHLFEFYYEDERLRCFGDAWEVCYDGPLKLQVEEVDSVHLMSMTEIIERSEAGEKFTPDSIHACREYVRLRGLLEATGLKPEVVCI